MLGIADYYAEIEVVIFSVSLVCLIIPDLKTIYSLDVQQNSSDWGLEQMVLKTEFKPDENQFLAIGTGTIKSKNSVSL